jgi:hypothetical protein
MSCKSFSFSTSLLGTLGEVESVCSSVSTNLTKLLSLGSTGNLVRKTAGSLQECWASIIASRVREYFGHLRFQNTQFHFVAIMGLSATSNVFIAVLTWAHSPICPKCSQTRVLSAVITYTALSELGSAVLKLSVNQPHSSSISYCSQIYRCGVRSFERSGHFDQES